ncbi:MAG: hypothetical protein U1F71_24435 [Verrucomicrobiaceae bacterium]
MKQLRIPLLTLLLPVFILGCQTTKPVLTLAEIQHKFDDAVKQDNLATVTQGVSPNYGEILDALTNGFIGTITEPKLKANAWMMRGVSEWRTERLSRVPDSSAAGLRAGPVPHSRDDILLHMLPALAIDSEVTDNWMKSGKAFTAAQYEALAEKNYLTAFGKLDEAKEQFGPATDDETKNLCAYHRWRMLLNWDAMIIHMNAPENEQEAASDRASAHFGGTSLAKLARAARESIPSSSPYRKLAESQMGSP